MLIENNALNIVEFKKLFSNITWTKLPRKLNVNHSDFFYTGVYETPDTVVKITVRPSMNMAISETFKNRMPMDGSIPPDNYRGVLVEWGSTVEIKVDEKFIANVDAVAEKLVSKPTQSLEW